jgi:hypothetical protein
MFPSSCGDDTTPGGVQNIPNGPAPSDAPMAPSSSPAVDNDVSDTGDAKVPEPPRDRPAEKSE